MNHKHLEEPCSHRVSLEIYTVTRKQNLINFKPKMEK